jgi:hypothetical protein
MLTIYKYENTNQTLRNRPIQATDYEISIDIPKIIDKADTRDLI